MHFQAFVRKLIDAHKPDLFGIESPAYDAGPFQTIHYGLMMFSLVPVFEKRIDAVLFDPATLKSLASEVKKPGMMGKLDMQRAVQLDTMDPDLINHNEADAYLVAKYSARFMGLKNGDIAPESMTEKERHVFLEKTKRSKGKTVRTAHIFRENKRFFQFSKIPAGNVSLPQKSAVEPALIQYLESLEK